MFYVQDGLADLVKGYFLGFDGQKKRMHDKWDQQEELTPRKEGYAAAEACVGLMIFHVMIAERLNMKFPVPPLPRFAEEYLPGGHKLPEKDALMQLEPLVEDASNLTAQQFFSCTTMRERMPRPRK